MCGRLFKASTMHLHAASTIKGLEYFDCCSLAFQLLGSSSAWPLYCCWSCSHTLSLVQENTVRKKAPQLIIVQLDKHMVRRHGRSPHEHTMIPKTVAHTVLIPQRLHSDNHPRVLAQELTLHMYIQQSNAKAKFGQADSPTTYLHCTCTYVQE